MEAEENKKELEKLILPQGGMKNPFIKQSELSGQEHRLDQETNNFILPQGDMKNQYHAFNEGFEYIEVLRIINYDKVSFKTQGSKEHPILLTDGKEYRCIYGWNFVESALAAEDQTIRCLVKNVKTLSDLCLSINTTALRIKPESDPVTYPERVQAFKVIMQDYEDAGFDTSHVEHGGARHGEALKNLKLDDFINKELVGALGKSRATILNYMSDAKYIAEDLFDHLIQHEAGKDFFEKIRNKKNEAIRSIEGGTKTDDFDFSEYTTIIISDNIRNALIEYKQDNPIPDFILLTQTESGYVKNEIKSVISQIEKCMEEENEKKRLDSLNSDEEKDEEVKFPSFEDNQPDNKEKELLIADVKKINEELGKLITDASVANFKDAALAICTKLMKRLTA